MIAAMALIDNDGDRELFDKLIGKYKSRIYAAAYRVLENETLAEDAVQETFFLLAKNFKLIKNLQPAQRELYISVTARHIALNTLRAEQKHLVCDPADDDILDDASLSAYERADIRIALEGLEYDDRAVLYLRYVSQLDYKAVGKALGISAAAARKRAQHARARFKTLLEGGNDDE